MKRVLDRRAAALLVVDVQEAFRPAVAGFDAAAARTAILLRGAQILGLPVVVTEQYPRGLGRTVPEVLDHLEGPRPLEKTAFSACRAEGFGIGSRTQALVCGIEAHVCVSQTVHDLLDRGVEAHVAADAVASRSPADREIGLAKMAAAGAVLTSTETALFELLGEAGTPEFKAIQGLVL